VGESAVIESPAVTAEKQTWSPCETETMEKSVSSLVLSPDFCLDLALDSNMLLEDFIVSDSYLDI